MMKGLFYSIPIDIYEKIHSNGKDCLNKLQTLTIRGHFEVESNENMVHTGSKVSLNDNLLYGILYTQAVIDTNENYCVLNYNGLLCYLQLKEIFENPRLKNVSHRVYSAYLVKNNELDFLLYE